MTCGLSSSYLTLFLAGLKSFSGVWDFVKWNRLRKSGSRLLQFSFYLGTVLRKILSSRVRAETVAVVWESMRQELINMRNLFCVLIKGSAGAPCHLRPAQLNV